MAKLAVENIFKVKAKINKVSIPSITKRYAVILTVYEDRTESISVPMITDKYADAIGHAESLVTLFSKLAGRDWETHIDRISNDEAYLLVRTDIGRIDGPNSGVIRRIAQVLIVDVNKIPTYKDLNVQPQRTDTGVY